MTGRIISSSFVPHPLLVNPHVQTVGPLLIYRFYRPDFVRQRLNTSDGDFVDLDWFNLEAESNKTAILIHGLGGASDSHYIPRIGRLLTQHGVRVVVLNLRGASGEPNRLPRTYHSGDTEDLDFVLSYLSDQDRDSELIPVGFSLGGNIVLKWLGENPDQNLIEKAIAVSVPFELAPVSDRLNHGFSKLYRHRLINILKKLAEAKKSSIPPGIDLQRGLRAKTFYEYDDAITAPLNQFQSAEDYYTKSSSRQYLNRINTDTLILHAQDDPFMTPEIIPGESELGSKVNLELSLHGGHVGFIGKGKGGCFYDWLANRILRYFLT